MTARGSLDRTELIALLEKALGALADIGLSDDMDDHTRRNKAMRIYREIREKIGDDHE